MLRSLLALGASLRMLYEGLKNSALHEASVSDLQSLGFGSINVECLIGTNLPGSNGIVYLTLIANTPHLILTFLYFNFNSLFTCMLLAREWNGYALKRKTLRVSTPKGIQRGTYWLQLPFRYGIPLLILSTALHWFVSQSIFLVRVIGINSAGKVSPDSTISTCGYSPIAVIWTAILGVAGLLTAMGNGLRGSRGSIPLAGSCSAAISAACHPPSSDVFASRKPIRFGEVEQDGSRQTRKRVGHCTFTSQEVTPPIEGKLYAGLDILHPGQAPFSS